MKKLMKKLLILSVALVSMSNMFAAKFSPQGIMDLATNLPNFLEKNKQTLGNIYEQYNAPVLERYNKIMAMDDLAILEGEIAAIAKMVLDYAPARGLVYYMYKIDPTPYVGIIGLAKTQAVRDAIENLLKEKAGFSAKETSAVTKALIAAVDWIDKLMKPGGLYKQYVQNKLDTIILSPEKPAIENKIKELLADATVRELLTEGFNEIVTNAPLIREKLEKFGFDSKIFDNIVAKIGKVIDKINEKYTFA